MKKKKTAKGALLFADISPRPFFFATNKNEIFPGKILRRYSSRRKRVRFFAILSVEKSTAIVDRWAPFFPRRKNVGAEYQNVLLRRLFRLLQVRKKKKKIARQKRKQDRGAPFFLLSSATRLRRVNTRNRASTALSRRLVCDLVSRQSNKNSFFWTVALDQAMCDERKKKKRGRPSFSFDPRFPFSAFGSVFFPEMKKRGGDASAARDRIFHTCPSRRRFRKGEEKDEREKTYTAFWTIAFFFRPSFFLSRSGQRLSPFFIVHTFGSCRLRLLNRRSVRTGHERFGIQTRRDRVPGPRRKRTCQETVHQPCLLCPARFHTLGETRKGYRFSPHLSQCRHRLGLDATTDPRSLHGWK